MSDLSPEAQALLDATRSAGGPSSAQRLAMKKAVLSSVAAPAAVVAVKSMATVKLVVLAVAGIGIGVGIAMVAMPRELPEPPVIRAPELPEPSRGPAPEPEVVAPEPPPVAVVKPPPHPVPVKPPVVVAAEPDPVAAPPPPAPAVDEATLSRELSALEEANETMRAGRFDDVLTQLAAYEDEFPTGALHTEAAVVKVLALCGLNRIDEARSLGASLPPNNPAVRRLERSCIK